jgi:putative ABC transport system permease protein
MNPLSPFTYHRRRKGNTLLLVGLIALATLGICVMVGMLYPILEHSTISVLGPLSHFSLVYPTASEAPETSVVSQIQAHPDVARAVPENGAGVHLNVPSLVVQSTSRVLGLPSGDVEYVLDACGLRLKEGRLLRPRTNELLLSKEFADALGVRVGDAIDRSIDEKKYFAIPTPMQVVGILESDPAIAPRKRARLAIASYEYLDSHELYAPRQSGLLVVAREGRKESVDGFLKTAISSPRTYIETREQKAASIVNARRTLNLILGIVDCLVAIVVALVVAMINQIALAQRLTDLGVLHAIGHRKNRLIRGLTLETAIMAGMGWLAGLALAGLILAWLKTGFYEPNGITLNLANPAPLLFALPIPLATVGFVVFSLVRVFARLDPVAIVERGQLSAEAQGRQQKAQRSAAKPLSVSTFYRRHHRRGLILVAVMALMILGVAFPVFFFSPMMEVQKPFLLNYLRYSSEVWPGRGQVVDPAVAAQIRAHPAVERVVPTTLLEMAISVPPVSESLVTLYGVSEQDLPYLVDLFGLQLKEGRLPHPRSNEIVLSESLGMNRRLGVGDAIGQPANERDRTIPTEMIIVGILSGGDTALGFASAEYLESHERYRTRSPHLLVIPSKGRKAELDRWLEENVASSRTLVETYDERLRDLQQTASNLLLLLVGVEGIIAAVAVLALAILNFILFTQRRDEFGILHAVGHSRLWLVLRTTRETLSMVVVAWLIGAAMCLVSLLYSQANIYAPAGLSLDLANLTPWLFTLPIPMAVVATSTGTIARTLARLDPVSIVESRS